VVTKKALAYVETIITTTCVHMLKGAKATGNPVQAYLGTLSLSQIVDLQKEVDAALEQCEDSNRHMAVYRGGDDLARRIRAQCFDKDKIPQRPHKANDLLHSRLHERLGYHSQHSIPIGFYYAKWSEKLHFHLSRLHKQERNHSAASSSRTRTPSPTMAAAPTRRSPTIASSSAATRPMSSEEAEETLQYLREKRAAIFDEAKDGLLTLSKEDKTVFRYRQGRRTKWKAAAAETMLNESEWNDQHDQESLEKLRETEEQLETLLAEHTKSFGYGPAGQGSN
jgi:hypothetical protein